MAHLRPGQREPKRPDFLQTAASGGVAWCKGRITKSWLSPPVTEPLRCASNRSAAARGIVTLGRTKEMEVAQLRRLRKQILRDQPAALIISHPVFSLYLSLSAEESAGAESHAAAQCDPGPRYSLREAGVSCMHKHCIAALQRGFAALQHCSALQLWRRSDGQNPRIGGICRRELGSVSSLENV